MESLSSSIRHTVAETMEGLTKPWRDKMLVSIGQSIADVAVDDPDMCECLRGSIRKAINLLWGDIIITVDMAVYDTLEQSIENHEHRNLAQLGAKPQLFSPMWWRAFVLYACLPFDKSIFGQAKDPWFWFFFTLSMITPYGVRIAFYSLLLFLILMRHPDEYQIVQFIMMLKGTFFLTGGVICGLATSVGYLRCVKPGGCHTCDVDGPAYHLHVKSGAVDLGGSCLLVWTAFVCLRWSVHHGWHKIGDREQEEAKQHKHGGHLGQLFLYDLFCILASAGVFWCLAYLDSDHKFVHQYALANMDKLCTGQIALWADKMMSSHGRVPPVWEWDYHRAFLFGRMFYALLSTPFVLFRLPGLNSILTHTTATGYNKQGRCVIFCLPPRRE